MDDKDLSRFNIGSDFKGSDNNTFIMEQSLLKQYKGNDAELRLPGFIFGVGNFAFSYNNTLKKVSLSSNVCVIGKMAFNGCVELEEIHIPRDLTTIGKRAFNRCKKLSVINFDGLKENWINITKGSGWCDDTPEFIIYCKDGIVTKQEALSLETTKEKVVDQPSTIEKYKNLSEDEKDELNNRLISRRTELAEQFYAEITKTDKKYEDADFSDSDDEDFKIYKVAALKYCIETQLVSVMTLKEEFKISGRCAFRIIDWMQEKNYILSKGQDNGFVVLIEEKDFIEKYGSVMKSQKSIQKQIPLLDSFLKNLNENQVETLNELAEENRKIPKIEITTEQIPSNSLWREKKCFYSFVLVLLEQLVYSDPSMARKTAIKKAETYLAAIKSVNDKRMEQVYERLVYELKITSVGTYNCIRNIIAGYKFGKTNKKDN